MSSHDHSRTCFHCPVIEPVHEPIGIGQRLSRRTQTLFYFSRDNRPGMRDADQQRGIASLQDILGLLFHMRSAYDKRPGFARAFVLNQ